MCFEITALRSSSKRLAQCCGPVAMFGPILFSRNELRNGSNRDHSEDPGRMSAPEMVMDVVLVNPCSSTSKL
jgi:hypothetical protein